MRWSVISAKSGIQLLLFFLFLAPAAWAAGPGSFQSEYHSYLRALLLESQGNLVAAQEELDKAMAASPDSAYLRRTAAEMALRLGQVARAMEEIEIANRLDPKDVKSLILAGQIHWALGHADKAEEKLKRAVALDPDASQATVSLAGALVQKNPKEAIRLYKDFLNRHPGEVEIHERLAQLYQASGEIEKSKGSWESVLEWAPGSVRAHLALAQIAEVKYDTGTAINHYELVMSQDPNNLALLLRVGELRYRSNEMAKASEAFNKAQALAPTSASVNFWLALLAENKGDWIEAIRLFKQVANNAPDPGVLLRLSYYYSQAGRHAEAVKVLEQLTVLQPNNTDFLSYLAVAYEQNKQFAKSEQTLQKLVQLAPDDYESRFQLATLYDRMKKFSKSEDQLQRAITIKPDYHMALNYLGYSYADRNMNLEEAEKLVMAALVMDPHNAAYLDSLGWVYFRQGKFDKAADFLLEASLKSKDALIWEHLGDVEAARGRWDRALLVWEESLLADPRSKSAPAKIQKTLSRLSNQEKVLFYVKRATIHFGDVKSFEGLVKITVCEKRPCFSSQASVAYERKSSLQMEIPGPLSGPLMVLSKKYKYPAKYGAIHPLFQSVEGYVSRAAERLESIFSTDQFRALDSSALEKNARKKGGGLVSGAENVSLEFDSKGKLKGIFWSDLEFTDSLKIGPYHPGLRPVPAFIEWEDEKASFRIKFEFLEPRAVILRESPQ